MNIKKTLILLIILFSIGVYYQTAGDDNLCVSEINKSSQNNQGNKIEIDSASLFYTSDTTIHAITFDNDGLMYLGGKHDVFTLSNDKGINHFIKVENPGPNTFIWSIRFDKNGNLYAAANDRIIKVTPDKKQYTVIKEDYTGPCGVTDLRFDQRGNLYVIYDKFVARYDSSLNKSIFIDGSKFKIPIQWGVGIEFSDDEKYLFIGDCGGSRAYIVPITEDNYYENSRIINTNFGQYFTKDKSGNIYITSIGGGNNIPELKMFSKNLTCLDIFCKNKPVQNENSYKKTIAYNEKGSGQKAIYCIIGNKIYSYPVFP